MDSFTKKKLDAKVIFTSVRSEKMLLRALDVDNINSFNFYIDKSNDYLGVDNNAIYPLIIYLKAGEIIKVEYQSPYTNALLNLEMKINQEK